ncbi:MAG: hypothetical protein H0W67_09205 [Gemmatimonadales bacterium]|nr:hypothetical protein [Gemmatimonadales bacterium]
MKRSIGVLAGALLVFLSLPGAPPAEAQVQVRVGDPARVVYSELHEGLTAGSPAADSILRVMRIRSPRVLWRLGRAAIHGTGDWNTGLVAFTRLATLRSAAIADSARRMLTRLDTAGEFPFPENPGLKPEDVEPSLHAIILERRRATRGDAAVLADILTRVASRNYDHGDAWVLGRLGARASDSLVARLQAADSAEFKVRYLTLLSYSTDPGLIPFLGRVYAQPDSFGIPKKYAVRASDGLLWIGTRAAVQALLDARASALRDKVYDDPSLARGGYDFLANDSSSVISRTGRWLTEWLDALPPAPE